MNRTLPDFRPLHSPARILAALVVFFCLFLGAATYSKAADTAVQVQLDTKEAKPRAVETLTERGILRDYRFAWKSMAQALESNSVNPLEGPFSGDAKEWLRETVLSQRHSGLSRRYDGQTHRLEAVFYAPEGDVMELHDTAEYQLQFLDGGKVVGDEHIVQHFVVLMTPGADHWVIRQLQAVPQF
ncbi:MAG: hypothetical protein WA824_02710 [Candidatus Sulfotelmatobacter sp.]